MRILDACVKLPAWPRAVSAMYSWHGHIARHSDTPAGTAWARRGPAGGALCRRSAAPEPLRRKVSVRGRHAAPTVCRIGMAMWDSLAASCFAAI